ncbi:MAG: MCP four helix bundle domain-containing protein [Paucibacter sp.]|nr:MCP four helix bundle domain-containing protein [Roseateles sp.]
MSFLRSVSIGQRLGLSFGLVLVLLSLLAGLSFVQMSQIYDAADYYDYNIVPSLVEERVMALQLNAYRRLGFAHILANTDAEMDQLEVRIADARLHLEQSFARYLKDDVSNDEDKHLLEAAQSAAGRYMDEWEKIRPISRRTSTDPSQTAEAQKLMMGPAAKAFEEADKALEASWNINLRLAKEQHESAAHGYASAKWSVSALVAISLLLGFGSAILVTRSITVPVQHAADVARSVATGDLSIHVEVNAKDETGQLLASLKGMTENLSRIVGTVRSGSDNVATASAEIAQGSLDLSSRTEEQASALEETAATMEQLSSTVRNNTDNAKQANHLAQDAAGVATQGGLVMDQVVSTMQGISDSSRKIGDIIGVIDGIAFQTNILALNAAVEAARAGEQGRGFAVVAAEVRSLAQRSAEAAKEIKSLITSNVEQVEKGSVLVGQAGKTMGEIVGSIKRVSDIVSEISSATSEQSSGIQQVGDTVEKMDQVTQQNAALVEESAAAAESLKHQAQQLVEAVSVFKLAGSGGLAELSSQSTAAMRSG